VPPVTPPAAGATWSASSPAAPKVPSSHLLVPKWLAFAVAAIVLVGIGFGVGWIAAPGDDRSGPPASSRQFPRGLNPPFGGPNGQNGNQGAPDGGSGNTNRAGGAFLGVAAQSSTNPQGVQIVRVASGSPADDAGLKVDDVVTKVDDQSVSSQSQLAQQVQSHDVGDQVTITYVRGGNTATAKVKLGDRNAQQNRAGSPAPSKRSGSSND
jgi:membrane-associated protease RseP (regulator of RpoE activity)